MPIKPAHKHRTWGTRFDPLPSSPPPSPRVRDTLLPRNAFDQPSDAPIINSDNKMPHDASIFVGSLPSHVDKLELVRMLSEHLSEHAEVKNIKVVRDSKGGLCAFVQCDDAASAARLIQALRSSESKPFLGRFLRYEPARAFRTLLISYRIPMQFIPPDPLGKESADPNLSAKFVELDLPTTMTLCRPWRAKYSSIFYNTPPDESQPTTPAQGLDQVITHHSSTLHLNPLVYDAETIRKLSSHFGSLEHFGPYIPDGDTSLVPDQSHNVENGSKDIVTLDDSRKSYPAPHDAPRASSMDPRCWEVKWDHRDDCVNALMTLRRVPHLTVTWAHQPTSSGFEHYSPTIGQRLHQPNIAPQVMFTQPSELATLSDEKLFVSSATQNPEELTSDTWDIPNANFHSSPLHSASLSPKTPTPLGDEEDTLVPAKKGEWTETDFPPLGDSKQDRRLQGGVWAEKLTSWVEYNPENSPLSPPSAILTSQTAPVSLTPQGISNLIPAECHAEEQELDVPPTPELGMSPITPKTPGSMFPDTPTGYVSEFQALTFNDGDGKESTTYEVLNEAEKILDLTTIFVGGLEMFGPSAWNEERVNDFFSKFGVVENVKLIRPANGRSAFAFVKFNDTDAPARAVLQQHNRIHDGRQMRVQLRDCNPSQRGAWKYGRGRGRYQHSGIQRQYGGPEDKTPGLVAKKVAIEQCHDQDASGPVDNRPGLGEATYATVPEFPTLNKPPSKTPDGFDYTFTDESGDKVSPRESEVHGTPSHPSSPSRGTSSQFGDFREWFEDPALTGTTPPSSSFGSSASAAAPPLMPCPVPNPGYYPPQPWMQPVPQHFPYPIPYMPGYPGFVLPPHQGLLHPTASDIGGPVGGVQNAWGSVGGMYTSYMPYPVYSMRVPSVDPSQAPQSSSSAPLLPTGFIHGEQGTLMPLYHPEALEQYMSTTRPEHPSFHLPQPSSSQPPLCPLPTQGQFQPGMNPGWPPGPPPSMFSALPFQQPDSVATPPFASIRQPMPVVSRGGGYAGKPGGQPHPTSSSARRPQRRDNQNAFNTNRHNRTLPNRYPRGGGVPHSPNVGQAARQPLATPPQFPSLVGDWNQWGGTGR